MCRIEEDHWTYCTICFGLSQIIVLGKKLSDLSNRVNDESKTLPCVSQVTPCGKPIKMIQYIDMLTIYSIQCSTLLIIIFSLCGVQLGRRGSEALQC